MSFLDDLNGPLVSDLLRRDRERREAEARTGDPSIDEPPDLPVRPAVPTKQLAPSKATRKAITPAEGEDAQRLTDLGNAKRVVERHGADLRYIHPWKTWLIWDGRRWAEDLTGEATRRVTETQTAIYQDTLQRLKVLSNAKDDEAATAEQGRLMKLLGHLIKWEDARAIGRSLELARSRPGVPILPANIDLDPFLLNVGNGTIDLRTGELRQHQRADLITKLAPVIYDTKAECPLWLKFLDRIMGSNQALVNYLQRVIGYSLTGDVSEQCLWFLYGTGQNGKSTFLGIVLAMLGDYGMQAVSELLLAKNHEAHPTERADLFGKRFAATIETDEGKRMAESLMKQLTGGDKIRARKMRQDFFEFAPTHKLFLAANHKPAIRGTDNAVWRRIKLVPFTVTIPKAEKDKALPAKLQRELPGILTWAVKGCLDWQREGLVEPAEVAQATAEYQSEQDTVQRFLEECCTLHAEIRVRVSKLLEAYQNWSGDRLMDSSAFGDRLRNKGYESKRGHGGNYFWVGIGLDQTSAGEPG